MPTIQPMASSPSHRYTSPHAHDPTHQPTGSRFSLPPLHASTSRQAICSLKSFKRPINFPSLTPTQGHGFGTSVLNTNDFSHRASLSLWLTEGLVWGTHLPCLYPPLSTGDAFQEPQDIAPHKHHLYPCPPFAVGREGSGSQVAERTAQKPQVSL